MRHPVLVLVLALAVGLGGCGGGGGSLGSGQAIQAGGPTLASADVDQVLEAEDSVLTTCGAIQDQEGSDLPLREAVAILVRVYRASGPEATFAGSYNNVTRNLETVLRENAERLRGCGRVAEAAALEREIAPAVSD